jgi:large subunit ribosomal protein L32
MGLPKKRTSKMRRDRRRASNFKLSPVSVATCPNCKEPLLPHTRCAVCKQYRGMDHSRGNELVRNA